MIIQTVLFYAFSFMTVASGVMVISSRNPVHSVLFLILAFFNAAGLFVLLGAEMLAMLLVIVYVGAVAVLFLFVVMMLNINFVRMKEGFLRYLPVGLLVAAVLFTELFLVLKVSSDRIDIKSKTIVTDTLENTQAATNAHAIGNVLYTDYIVPFQLAGIILLIAMVGAITLTLRRREGVKKQDVEEQLSRDPSKSVELVKVKVGEGV